jgi:hypothetical protein
MPLNCGEGNGVRLAGRTSQSTARIDRTARKVLIPKDFVRPILLVGAVRICTIIARNRKYHSPTDHVIK